MEIAFLARSIDPHFSLKYIWNFNQAPFRNVELETYALIQYLGSKETLTVMTDVDNEGDWKHCFQVSGIRLPTSYYIGLSAATGDLAGSFAIFCVKYTRENLIKKSSRWKLISELWYALNRRTVISLGRQAFDN